MKVRELSEMRDLPSHRQPSAKQTEASRMIVKTSARITNASEGIADLERALGQSKEPEDSRHIMLIRDKTKRRLQQLVQDWDHVVGVAKKQWNRKHH